MPNLTLNDVTYDDLLSVRELVKIGKGYLNLAMYDELNDVMHQLETSVNQLLEAANGAATRRPDKIPRV